MEWEQRYRLDRKLGAGSFGEVYRAYDRRTGTTVAVKILSRIDEDALARFRREGRILYDQAKNRHVVRLLGWHLVGPKPCLVLEFCDGGSLRSWVGRSPSWRQVAMALAQTLEGLHAIHLADGFHRDLKPDNLLLKTEPDADGYVIKVADFGIARHPVTRSGPVTRHYGGTPGYIAPEVIEGRPFTKQADIYSLGVIAVELLTGVRVSADLPRSAPEGLRSLIRRMTLASPGARPEPQEVAAALAAILTSKGPEAAEPVQNGGDSVAGLVVGGVALAAVAAGLAAIFGGGRKKWNRNVSRYRGSDGRFKEG